MINYSAPGLADVIYYAPAPPAAMLLLQLFLDFLFLSSVPFPLLFPLNESVSMLTHRCIFKDRRHKSTRHEPDAAKPNRPDKRMKY